jgi:hypothetical protein
MLASNAAHLARLLKERSLRLARIEGFFCKQWR